MDSTSFHDFMADQIKEIREFCQDNTNEEYQWIIDNSESFRQSWERDHS